MKKARKRSGEKNKTSEILRGFTLDKIGEEHSGSSRRRRKRSRQFKRKIIVKKPQRKIKSILKKSRRFDGESPSNKFDTSKFGFDDKSERNVSVSPTNKSVRFNRKMQIFYFSSKKKI